MHSTNLLIDGISITPCEFAIVRQAMMDHPRKQIADALRKKPATLDSQMRLLYAKLGVRSIIGLVNWGWRHGFDSEGNYTPRATPFRARTGSVRGARHRRSRHVHSR